MRCVSKHNFFLKLLFLSSRPPANDGNVRGDFDSWAEMSERVWKGGFMVETICHQSLVSMFYLKVCTHIYYIYIHIHIYIYIYIYIYKVERAGTNNYYNWGRGGSKKSVSSNQRRHTQGREKRTPSSLMLCGKTNAKKQK